MRFILRFALVLAFVVPAALAAQPAGVLPKATHLPGSTRAMALGDSYMMDAGHADALFYHPALLTGASGFGLELQRWSSVGSATAASAAVQWLGGGIGIGLRTLQYLGPASGAAAAPAGQAHLFEVGLEPVSERVATLGYAREVFGGVSLGLAMDLVDERIGFTSHNVALFDVGAAKDLGPIGIGLTVHDLGAKPLVDAGDHPAAVVLGVGGYGKEVGIFDFGFAANLGAVDGGFTYGGGVEVGYWPVQGRTFVVRIGFDDPQEDAEPESSPFTAGLAFWGDDVTVEWAFRPVSDAEEGGTHRFGLRWR